MMIMEMLLWARTPPSGIAVAPDTLKDADGDIIMQDLDDTAVTLQIVGFLEGERGGDIKKWSLDTSVHLDYSARSTVVKWVLVVDTSFILSHLQLVNSLVQAYFRWGNVVMLPWATIMELDGLKKSNSTIRHKNADGVEVAVSVGSLARRANNWSFETMKSQAKGLWGQMKEEVLDRTATKGDTAILDCCRYVKEIKGFPTAILSNDKNLCVKALVYGIKAVSFTGTPFTADGIMSVLEGSKSGEVAFRAPGIWETAEDANKTVDSDVKISSHSKDPSTVRVPMGLYASRHATSDDVRPRRQHQPESVGSTPGVALTRDAEIKKLKADLGILLVRIEADLVDKFIPLLHRYWEKLPEGERRNFPELGENQNIEYLTWKVLQFSFDSLYPRNGALRQKIRNSDLTYDWNKWSLWVNSELATDCSVRPAKPTSKDIVQFIEDWEILWAGLLNFADNWESTSLSHVVTLASWKMMASGLTPQLDAAN
ncbi:PIN domain-containing protein [Sphaerosporella brunnea]|uniref:PIN domain-containing protein n=1 Tax=Sphaerosporella brunnea TaxID=1250544 RepID=A0A5J5F5H6_9PEZI|nr:PIN domain-containing protein [Sphaerosporella brunnea]